MSSRIIVKNLPKYLTQERFKEHFVRIGEVTDVRLVHTQYVAPRVFFLTLSVSFLTDQSLSFFPFIVHQQGWSLSSVRIHWLQDGKDG